MSASSHNPEIRRILVALDASPSSLMALQAAVELAARIEAELLGLFVEDIGLLRFAEAPFAREILFPSATEGPLNRPIMESRLRAQSEQARQAMAAAAQRAHVEWSFRTVRGRVTEEILAAAGEADLVAIGRVGWSHSARARLGSTALKVATSSIPVLLLSERGMPSQFHLVVYFDGSPAAKRALLAAAQLAEAGTRTLCVLIAAVDRDNGKRIQEEVETSLQNSAVEVQYRLLDLRDEMSLPRALQAERAGILVLGNRQAVGKPEALESLFRETDMTFLLLDNR